MKDMEYGISTWIYEKRTLKEALQKIADIGIQCIEIWANEYHLDPRIKPDIGDIQKQISSLGLWVHSIHTPFTGLNLGYPDTSLIKKWLSVVGESMEYGAELGAKIAVVHVTSFREHLNQTDQNRSIGVIREFLENLENHARKMDMRLALENLPAAHNPSFACSIEELAKIGADEEIGFCIDIGHSSINKVDFESDIINAGSRLLSVHLSSNDGENDSHWVPSKGVIDWREVKELFYSIGYRGPFLLEINGGDDPDSVLENIKEFAKNEQASQLQ